MTRLGKLLERTGRPGRCGMTDRPAGEAARVIRVCGGEHAVAYLTDDDYECPYCRVEALEAEAKKQDEQLYRYGDEMAELRLEAQRLKTALAALLDVVIWMSGSPSFSPEGEAAEGWKKNRGTIDRAFAALEGRDG